MKKILFTIALALSSIVAQAGPLEDVATAFKQAQTQAQTENDKVQAQGSTETVVRGYIASASGLLKVTAAESYIGSLVTRAAAEQAIYGLGYKYVTSQHQVDVYKMIDASGFGSILMVYYNTAGFCSEVYLINDKI